MSTVQVYKRPIIVGALGVVTAILLYALLISPQSSKLALLQTQTNQLQTQQQELHAKLIKLQAETKTLPSQCAALQKLAMQIPSVDNPGDLAAEQSSFYNQLTALVGSSGTSIPSFAWTGNTGTGVGDSGTTTSPLPGTSASINGVPVKMHITGNFGQMFTFIKGLDSFPRLFVIQTFTLSFGAAGGSTSGPLGPPLWVGQLPNAATGGPYSLDIAGSIYFTTTPDALAACIRATSTK